MANHDPVAIIGYSYRAPGTGRKDLLTFLREGRSAWSKVPPARFDHAAYYSPDHDKQGCSAALGGCFLQDDLYAFDAAFFNLRADEARAIDPQHRLVLECAFEAAENAGITINQLAGSNVGVFAANDVTEYGSQSMDDLPTTSKYTATAGAACMFANRVSYFFDLEGPSISLDVACAGGSSALHLAVQNIRAGECRTAFVAAANLMVNHSMWTAFDTMGALSESGRCHSYDAKASGFGRGEGAACLLIKNLSDAIRDGDPIHAIVANTACNHGGKTDGITQPSGPAQERLLRRVHDEINWDPADTVAVEGHGTGTKLGDPIEASSIATVLGLKRTASSPVYLGSIKSNIGHTESVSGIMAVIKAILQLQQDQIFPTSGFETLNPAINCGGRLRVLNSVAPWPSGELKRSCVLNFGFGGGNAATLLEAYDKTAIPNQNRTQDHHYIVPFSAKNETSLRAYLSSFRTYLDSQTCSPALLRDLSHTLGNRRTHFTFRACLSAGDLSSLRDKVTAATERTLRKAKTLRTAFVFTGQGAQYAQMATGLRRYAIFADALAEAQQHLESFGAQWTLQEELERPEHESRVNEPEYSQPLCTAVQIALLKLFRSWSLEPDVVLGHSSGEIAAAFAAGFVSYKAAMAAAYFRGQAAKRIASKDDVHGGMLALGISAEEAAKLLSTNGYATIAAINSARSVTVSGDVAAIEAIEQQAHAQGVFARRLKVNVAYHSDHLRSVATSYLESMQQFYGQGTAPRTSVDFVSSVTGRTELMDTVDASYWVMNLIQPVRFFPAVEMVLADHTPNLIVEVGPHSALKGPITQILETDQTRPLYLPTLVRGVSSEQALLDCASAAFEAGIPVDFAKINQTDGARVLSDLPAYEWNKSESYQHMSRIAKMKRNPGSPYNALLGWRSPYTEGNDVSFRQVFTLDEMPWLRDHNIAGEVIFPMTGYTSLAVEALRNVSSTRVDAFVLNEFHAKRSLKIVEDERVDITTKLTPAATGTDAVSSSAWTFQILTWTEARGWTVHCNGRIDSADTTTHFKSPCIAAALDTLSNGNLKEHSVEHEYQELTRIGLRYGPKFRRMIKFYESAPGTTVHEVAFDESDDASYNIASNAPVLDALLHSTSFIESKSRERSPLIPTHFRQSRGLYSALIQKPATLTIVTREVGADDKLGSLILEIAVFARLLNGELVPVLEMEHLTVRAIGTAAVSSGLTATSESYDWTLVPYSDPIPNAGGEEQFIDLSVPLTVCGLLSDTEEGDFANEVLTKLGQNRMTDLVRLSELQPQKGVYYIFIDNERQSITKDLSEETFSKLQNLLLDAAGVLWVVSETTDPHAHTMKGFLRSLRIEDGSRPFFYLEGPPQKSDGAAAIAAVAARFGRPETLADQEFVYASGLYMPRLQAHTGAEGMFDTGPKPVVKGLQRLGDQPEENALQMTVSSVGSLDSVYFRRVDLTESLADDEIIVRVEAAGVNFRDLLLVLGSMPWHTPGLEGVGIVSRVGEKVGNLRAGDRVCYASMQAGFASHVRIPALFAHRVPDGIDPVQMASIPVAYSTAYWCLERVAQVKPGETVLIHAASGAVGQACITVARSLGAKIFVTAGTDTKRAFLHETFGIPYEKIFSSRTDHFRDEILCATEGKGVDVIVNSLSGHLLEQTWSVIAEFGRFIEIGKKDLIANSYLGMRPFERNVAFHAIDLRQLFLKRPAVVQECLADIVKKLQEKVIAPISVITEVSLTDFEAGLRKLQTGNNIGKVVIKVSPDDRVYGEPPKELRPAALLKSEATYVITGGTGGIGRSLAVWLFEQGAQHVVLLGRSGSSNPDVAELLKHYPGLRAIACDVGFRSSLEAAVAAMKDLPPVRGVIHGALYLRDAFLVNSTFQDWQKVTAPKINAAWNLHELLPNLDFFICLASIAGVTGNAGQTIYAGTTTFLDSFAAYRRKQGLPTVSLNLPVIDDAGYAKDHGLNALLRQTLGVWLNTPQVHILVRDAILACKSPDSYIEGQGAVSFIRGHDSSAGGPLPFERFEMFSAMRRKAVDTATGSAGKHDASTFLPALVDRICSLTMMDADEVDPDGDLAEYGLDSLISVELRNWIRRETGTEMALNQILSIPSLRALVKQIYPE